MINFAHRGASRYYPENTILSLKEGIKGGANGLEIDVHKTKDNELVVIHDEDIERTFKGKGLVKDMTLEELKAFKCRNKNFEDNIECKIPTLKEVLELVSQGFSNKEIADKIYVREVTVKTHLNSIFKKLKVTNRTQAVLLAKQI